MTKKTMTQKVYSRTTKNIYLFVFAAAFLAAFCGTSSAETPAHFAQQFANFKFSYREKIQDPDVFLANRSGDCDDFATLADSVLRENGYSPRLFAVRMKGITHVVCYIQETGAYLDYNNRSESNPLVSSDGSLTDIARKVSASFGKNWLAAYEFSYREKAKWLVNRILFNSKFQPQPLLASE